MKKLITAILIAASAQWASADGLKSLENFMKTVQTGQADFTQTVVMPAKDGQVAKQKNSSGSFEFQRPGRFRFVYKKPFEQTIVADGQTLWFYDVDLAQVTQRSQSQALGATPVAILASGSDLQALRADFTLASAPAAEGLEWVLAQPKVRDGQLQSVRVGFDGERLAALQIVDSFGQQSTLRFANLQTNVPLPTASFQFKPPAGVDVLRQ